MSDTNTPATNSNADGNKALKKVLGWLVIANVIWSVLCATLQSILLAEAGIALGTSAVGTTVAAILTWIISFGIAFFIGAIGLTILCVFVVGIAIVVMAGKKKGGTANDASSTPDQSAK